MYTIAETDDFIAQSKTVWSDDEKSDFITFLSTNPLAGDVIPKTGGFRKLRWSAKGKGKQGGVRVIYYNLLENGMIVCFSVYAKNKQENIAPNTLKGKKQ